MLSQILELVDPNHQIFKKTSLMIGGCIYLTEVVEYIYMSSLE